ncbi:hypothetical protein VFPBJ_11777 [Purpureocillium lilacinum]|uniref:Uncharacterized protein n=1 Tax=Purpureocillium lilacinum TaxID=33203 RepID=A0A179EWF6_PURLI|nr:hypothetical protein VFPBJ_11777 [Purpureocillium lilacinum]
MPSTVLKEPYRKWVDGRLHIQGYPPWVPPDIMREQLLNLLDQCDAGKLPEDEAIGNLVLLVERTGFCRWGYALPSAATYRKPRNGWSRGHVAIMDVLLGHESQWCLENTVDARGRYVPWEERMVIDPEFVLSSFDRGEKSLRTTLEEAEFVPLKAGDWRNRWQVSAWRLNMATWWVETKRILEKRAFMGTLSDNCRGFVEKQDSKRLWTPPYPCTGLTQETGLPVVEFPATN